MTLAMLATGGMVVDQLDRDELYELFERALKRLDFNHDGVLDESEVYIGVQDHSLSGKDAAFVAFLRACHKHLTKIASAHDDQCSDLVGAIQNAFKSKTVMDSALVAKLERFLSDSSAQALALDEMIEKHEPFFSVLIAGLAALNRFDANGDNRLSKAELDTAITKMPDYRPTLCGTAF
jgi:hypothetical protein